MKVAEISGLDLSNAEELPYVLIEVDKNEVLIKASSLDTKSIHFQQRAILYINYSCFHELVIFLDLLL